MSEMDKLYLRDDEDEDAGDYGSEYNEDEEEEA